jgi:hypothetical protein
MYWTVVQKMGGWLVLRPDGENDRCFYHMDEAFEYAVNKNLELLSTKN